MLFMQKPVNCYRSVVNEGCLYNPDEMGFFTCSVWYVIHIYMLLFLLLVEKLARAGRDFIWVTTLVG